MTATDGSDDVSRRTFLLASAGTAAAAGGASVTASAQDNESGDGGGNETEDGGGNESTDGGGGGGETHEVVVGPGGETVFDPDSLTIAPGDTVHWVWDSDTHNVVPDGIPEGSSWEGHPEIADAGTEYEFTFETQGTFEYICEPHVSAGMAGSITVQEGGASEDGGHQGPVVPNSALSLAVGTIGAMVSTLALAYFFIKYGGYEEEA
jgi:plastocyanin